jgi:hypothetical protein
VAASLLAIALPAFAQTSRPSPPAGPSVAALADAAYDEKRYGAAGFLYAAAVADGSRNNHHAYNAACSFALAGQSDLAFEFLNRAFELGYREVQHVEIDPDLTSLHADPRWPAAIARCRAEEDKYLASVANRELRAELLKMRQADQDMRFRVMAAAEDPAQRNTKAFHDLMQQAGGVDTKNTARMKEIIAAHGWPGVKLVGADGASAAWLLVQHADADREFQKQCLELMSKAVEQGDASGRELAYLTDRIRLADGQKQLYGTQFMTGPDGKTTMRPCEDEANLDQRRSAVGLEPIAEYRARMETPGR